MQSVMKQNFIDELWNEQDYLFYESFKFPLFFSLISRMNDGTMLKIR